MENWHKLEILKGLNEIHGSPSHKSNVSKSNTSEKLNFCKKIVCMLLNMVNMCEFSVLKANFNV